MGTCLDEFLRKPKSVRDALERVVIRAGAQYLPGEDAGDVMIPRQVWNTPMVYALIGTECVEETGKKTGEKT